MDYLAICHLVGQMGSQNVYEIIYNKCVLSKMPLVKKQANHYTDCYLAFLSVDRKSLKLFKKIYT